MKGTTVAMAALLLGVSLPSLSLAAQRAETVDVAQAKSYNFAIPAQPLTSALVRYTGITGLDLAYDGVVATGLPSPGATGTLGQDQALAQLLSGTGITYRFSGEKSVTLYNLPVADAGATTLAPLVIEGRTRSETAWGPVEGYAAKRAATATKTDTPLNETPQSISVIGREQMNVQGVNSLATALRYSPGASGEMYGQDTRGYGLQLRGFTASDESYYRDGLGLRGADYATFMSLDTYGAERLEILRGPSSVLYGQNSPGGLINYVSRRPSDVFGGEIEGVIGNFNRFEGKFDVTGPANDSGTLLYRFTGLVRDSEVQTDYVDDDRVFVAPAFTWKPNEDTSVTILTNYQKDQTGWSMQFLPRSGTVSHNNNGQIPMSRFAGDPDFDSYDLEQASIGYLAEHKLNDTFTLRQNARLSHLENTQEGVFGMGFATSSPAETMLLRYSDMGKSTLTSAVIDNQAQAKFDTGPVAHTMLVGFDYQRHIYRDLGASAGASDLDIFNPVYGNGPTTPWTIYGDTRQALWQAGVYGQEQMKLFDKLVVVLGGRYDWTNLRTDDRLNGGSTVQKNDKFTGRAGLVYLTDIGLSPYVSYSESFMPELGSDASGTPFRPSTGSQYEIGVKYQPPGMESFVNLALFELKRDGLLTSDPLSPTNSIQTGKSRSRGFELEAVGNVLPGLNIVGAYAYYDVEFTDNEDGTIGNTPYGIPKHRASLWADYKVQSGGLTGLGFGGGVRYVGWTWGDDANSFRVRDYTLFDAALSYDFGNYRFGLNASNLFDKDYVASCSSDTGCYYGTGRTVTASVKYSW